MSSSESSNATSDSSSIVSSESHHFVEGIPHLTEIILGVVIIAIFLFGLLIYFRRRRRTYQHPGYAAGVQAAQAGWHLGQTVMPNRTASFVV